MSISRRCKRGNIAERDKWGHCLCKECKEFRVEKNLKWVSENREKYNQTVRKWGERNPDKLKEIKKRADKKYKDKNPDKVKDCNRRATKKWRDTNPDKQRECVRTWDKNNKGAKNAIRAKRRAALLRQTPKWADLNKIKQVYIESARLTQETGIKHEVDHIIPLQGENISGLHVHYNLQILTQNENRSKHNKVEGWLKNDNSRMATE